MLVCEDNRHLLVWRGKCSCPRCSLGAGPMCECLRILWWERSIVFLFYLLASYISTSRGKGHTEPRVKDTGPWDAVREHRETTIKVYQINTMKWSRERQETEKGQQYITAMIRVEIYWLHLWITSKTLNEESCTFCTKQMLWMEMSKCKQTVFPIIASIRSAEHLPGRRLQFKHNFYSFSVSQWRKGSEQYQRRQMRQINNKSANKAP